MRRTKAMAKSTKGGKGLISERPKGKKIMKT